MVSLVYYHLSFSVAWINLLGMLLNSGIWPRSALFQPGASRYDRITTVRISRVASLTYQAGVEFMEEQIREKTLGRPSGMT